MTEEKSNDEQSLPQTLGPVMLWGLGVGYVISGMYFGWNLGLEQGGTLGLAIATFFIMLMYVTFTMSYTELSCAIPKAGGVFSYAEYALGPTWGFIAGIAQIIEFVFAPPAIAAAIGAYLHIFFPAIPIIVIAIGAYFVFTLINLSGVKTAAIFELVVTVIAVSELLIFSGLALTAFEFKNLSSNSLPNGISGIFAAVPFAIWFFLAIEGIANVAAETKNPQKNVVLGFSSAMATLVVLCLLVFVSAVGVNGWESVVFDPKTGSATDSPLPLALGLVVGEASPFYHLLIGVGIFGLVASFHGILLAAGRATYEMGHAQCFFHSLGTIHPQTKAPVKALLFNMFMGIIALLTGRTSEIIILACFGALTLYIIAMVSFFVLRSKKPQMKRPFCVPFYPVTPIVALCLSICAMICMITSYLYLFGIFLLLLGGALVLFVTVWKKQDGVNRSVVLTKKPSAEI